MKKTLVLYRDYQDMTRWLDEHHVRSHRSMGIYKTKIDKKFYVLQGCYSGGLGSNQRQLLRKEELVDVIWLGDPKVYRNAELLRDVQSIVKCRFQPTEKLPERDMSLGGMAQFHSIPVRVRLCEQTSVEANKAWYMYHTKTWAWAGTTMPIEVAEWYVDWFVPE